jgi:hypothetical protein
MEAIESSVDIELLIEGQKRSILYKSLTQHSHSSFFSPGNTSNSVYRLHNSFFLKDKTLAYCVKHLSIECVYYALFDFDDDYIVCPAFFAGSLRLKNIAILNVANETILSNNYIFVKKNDFLVNFLKDTNNLIREYYFKPGKDVIGLNSANKNMICFKKYDDSSSILCKEWQRLFKFSKNTPSFTEEILPYVFIPQIVIETFAFKHKDFFIEDNFTLFGTSLIHNESKSYSEIMDTMDKRSNIEDLENRFYKTRNIK